MIEKVNMYHPDKVADRIAGAIVDLAYRIEENPKIAVEVLIGHNKCQIIIETSLVASKALYNDIKQIVYRIANSTDIEVDTVIVQQDKNLAENQLEEVRCGDNGIFRGIPLTEEEKRVSMLARWCADKYKSDGKYIIDKNKIVICQSNAKSMEIARTMKFPCSVCVVNPLGEWSGGINVDTGATNRKLGSDMGHSVTGGGLHGKDLSKGDVSINIYAFDKAQRTGEIVEISCAIGDKFVDGRPYKDIVQIAREYIENIGGFEKLAEWGLF